MKSLSAKTFQCGVTVQGLTTLSGTVYLTALTNTATWDYVVVGTTAQGQLYTRTYAQLMSDITSGIGLSGYVPTSRTLTINGVSYDLTANRSWTISTVDYTSRLQHVVKAGVAINKGQAVYVTSADGTNMIVGLASNASEATSSKTMGLLDATVSTNGFANVVTEGLLAGLDTSTAGTEGDPVWLGTGGNLIYGLANKPYAPAHLVFIGIVTRKNNSNGEIFVKVQNGFELNEIHDVDLKTNLPVNGELLGFNGTLWVNKTIAGWLGYTPANASGTTNYISKFTGSTTLGNSQIYDNGSNVGIGTTTPGKTLDITGEIRTSGRATFNEYVNTGFIYGNTDLVLAYSGGTSGILINSSGNVGIGTNSPGYKLEVNGTGYFAGNLKLQTGILSFDGVSGYWGNAIKYETGQLNLYQSGDLHLGIGGNTITLYKNTKIPHNQRFTAGGYSDTDGITIWGTQNASAGGDGFIGRNLYYNGTNYIYASTNDSNLWGTIAGMRVVGNSSNALEFIARPATNSGLNVVASDLDSYKRMVISYSGNVGIGTTSPQYKLDVNGSFNALTSGVYLTYNSGILYHGNYYQFTSGNNYLLYARGGGDLLLGSNDTERMRILANGNVGIGTSSPGYKLDVSGQLRVDNGVANGSGQALIVGGSGDVTLSDGGSLFFGAYDYGGSTYLRGYDNGNILYFFVNGSNIAYLQNDRLYVAGTIFTSSHGNSSQWNTAYGWGNHSSAGYVPQARTLTINGTSYDLSANRSWTIATTTPGGSDTQFQYNSSGSLAGASALTYNSTTNRVGINQASPGYDLDVNGQVRVQDKLRVGTVNSGNGVVHMSSSATINPSATTIVWAQNVSVGMCAFIEYYILNNNSLTDQRAGTIMVTWNQSGTPTIAHTETTTPDIGSTTTVNFTSSLVGSDARINAVNSSANPYTIVMSYKYF